MAAFYFITTKYTHCPKCNSIESLAVVDDAITVKPPEGAIHVIGCTKCGWNRSSTHIKGIIRHVPLKSILNAPTTTMSKKIRRFL